MSDKTMLEAKKCIEAALEATLSMTKLTDDEKLVSMQKKNTLHRIEYVDAPPADSHHSEQFECFSKKQSNSSSSDHQKEG